MRKFIVILTGFILMACSDSIERDIAQSSTSYIDQSSAAQNLANPERIQTMSKEAVREGYIRNATLAQLYRWYQIYENDAIPISNSLDILTPEVTVKSNLGEASGHASYSERVRALPKEWENAHQVKSTDITIERDGTIRMTVNINYENQGILPEGAVRTADLSYMTSLSPTDTVLPKFNSVEIIQNSEGKTDTLVPRYVENRIKSLVYYWFAIIEDPKRNPEPARGIFADNFTLNFSSGAIKDFAGFKAWLAGPGSAIAASTHTITAFDHKVVSDTEYKMFADFEWQGIQADGTELIAKTRHSWIIIDNPKERFARIKQVEVELLIPFQPKPE